MSDPGRSLRGREATSRRTERQPESMARGAALVTGASALFVVSGYAVNVWLGRMLGPVDFGRFGVVLALITILNVLQNASVPQAVARYTASHPEGAATLLRRGLVLQLGVGVLLAAALGVAAPLTASALGDDALTDALRVAALIVPPYGVYALLVAYHNGRRAYTPQAAAQAAYAIGKVVAVIALAYPMRLIGAVIGYVAAAVIGCLAAAVRPRGAEPAVGMWPLLRLAAPLSIYALASVALFSVDILFVKAVGPNAADAGLYAAAQSIARIPYFLMSGLAVLVLPALAGMAQEKVQARAGAARQALRIAVLAAVPIAAILAGSAPGALELLYGSTYASDPGVLSVLAVGMAALAVASVAAGLLSGVGHAGWSAAIAAVGFCVAVIGCAVSVAPLGSIGAAIATTASTVLTLVLLLARLESVLPGALPWPSLFRVTAISAGISIVLAVLDLRGLLLVAACAVASLVGVCLFSLSGEIGREDLARLRAGFHRR